MHVVHVLPTCFPPHASLNVYVYVNRPPEQYNMLNGLSLVHAPLALRSSPHSPSSRPWSRSGSHTDRTRSTCPNTTFSIYGRVHVQPLARSSSALSCSTGGLCSMDDGCHDARAPSAGRHIARDADPLHHCMAEHVGPPALGTSRGARGGGQFCLQSKGKHGEVPQLRTVYRVIVSGVYRECIVSASGVLCCGQCIVDVFRMYRGLDPRYITDYIHRDIHDT